jgi:Type II secretory pathway, ATPase PulE/Tfp pilus assembly pathway, ATPase PilB
MGNKHFAIEEQKISVELQQLLTAEQAWFYGIVPKSCSDKILEFYVDSSKNISLLSNELEVLFNRDIIFSELSSDEIQRLLAITYRKRDIPSISTSMAASVSSDFLLKIVEEASSLGASDIHMEPYEHNTRVRFRIDGKLIEKYMLPKEEYPSIVNKVKIKSSLDISEKRLPQDGRILFNRGNNQFDIRVSVLPVLYGEKIVLRLLNKDTTRIELKELGLSDRQYSELIESIKNPHGIVLVSGPTGSGKTTTLYAVLKILNREELNILTIEDPIEYTLSGVNQVQLRENIGLTFASALRTFLRQDPDIIMLGEVRDPETAQMAIRASLTGHLVLSTIHTNSAWGIIARLLDMGIPSFLLADTLNMVIAQRLIRLLCPHCKRQTQFKSEMLPPTFLSTFKLDVVYEQVGCEMCYFTGYKGRKALYEIVPIDSDFSSAIREERGIVDELMKQKGIESLARVAIKAVISGETSIDEVYPILKNKDSE